MSFSMSGLMKGVKKIKLMLGGLGRGQGWNGQPRGKEDRERRGSVGGERHKDPNMSDRRVIGVTTVCTTGLNCLLRLLSYGSWFSVENRCSFSVISKVILLCWNLMLSLSAFYSDGMLKRKYFLNNSILGGDMENKSVLCRS
jgi:hypothetical protein